MFIHNRLKVSLLLILLLTITSAVPTSARVTESLLADPFYVVSTTPLANQLAVNPADPVEIAFNLALNTDTVTTETLTIHGDQTGYYQGAISTRPGLSLNSHPQSVNGISNGSSISIRCMRHRW